MLQKVVFLALAGALGTLARYGLSGLVQKSFWGDFSSLPAGTLAVNIAGCFLFVLVWTLAEERLVISNEMRIVVLVGFMGAFTTFSTFAFETAGLMRGSQWTLAMLNIVGQNVAGIASIFVGMAAGRMV